MSKDLKLFTVGVTCSKCNGLLHEVGKIVVKSFACFRVTEYILAVCVVCNKIHEIERIWEELCPKFEDKEVQDGPQTKI